MIGYGKVETKLDRDLLLLKTMEWAEMAVEKIADETIGAARLFVEPGVGPGPHPHPERLDTGNLRENIIVLDRGRWSGMVFAMTVGNDLGAFYGTYLELGWHSKDGSFHRWPWLYPGFLRVEPYIDAIISGLPKME